MNISPNQLAAARALKGLSQTEVAKATKLSRNTIARFEREEQSLNENSQRVLLSFFDGISIRFTEFGGVENKPKREITVLKGQEGFRKLMTDVYDTALNADKINIEIINGTPALFVKHLGSEWYAAHAKRMQVINDKFSFRIIAVNDGEEIAQGFATYKWFAEDEFFDNCLYIYANKVAFISFDGDDVEIELMQRDRFAKTFNLVFEYMWKSL